MNKYENYLIGNGMHYVTARKYVRMVYDFMDWLEEQGLTPKKVKKRSQFTAYLKYCYDKGNGKRTVAAKETAIKRYYEFLGTKFNPAHRWKKQKKEHTLPTKPLERKELQEIYDSIQPSSPAQYRDRSILGLIVFQGLMRQDVEELRLSDIDIEEGTVYVIGKRRTNSRKLKLEYKQGMQLYDYIQKYRNDFLAYKNEDTDKLFLSQGSGNRLSNAFSILLRQLRLEFPQIEDFTHLRTSVISHWEKEDGIIEAKVKAGHRYVTSTARYQTDCYDELKEELITMHPFGKLNFT